MRAKRAHHARGVIVRIAAAETDEMHAALAIRINNLARDVMRALDEIRDNDVVANALAPVGAQVSLVSDDHVSWKKFGRFRA